MGPLFDFDGVRAAKNIALGYMDTMREFGRLGGTAYGILPDENSFMQDFAVEYQEMCIRDRGSTIVICCKGSSLVPKLYTKSCWPQ